MYITYSSSSNKSLLLLAQTNLSVVSLQPLDYEAQSKHSLILTVENVSPLSNKAPNLPVSTATVTVNVVNENEAPRFREDPIQIFVPESVAPGTLLKTNIALDPDHSDLRYDAEAKIDECAPVIIVQLFIDPFLNVCL